MDRERGVSSVLGVVLILAITLGAITSIMLIGVHALQTTQDDTELAQMETAMSEMSSKASLAALGGSGKTSFDLGRMGEGQLIVDETMGTVTITINNSETEVLFEDTLGALIYQHPSGEIAYQGGGVWKAETGQATEMISPPEYHYREETLTFPMVRITGDGTTAGNANGNIESGEFSTVFPVEDGDNPLENETVTVRIESPYHEGWNDFFRTRADGNITHNPNEGWVESELSPTYDEAYEEAVARNQGSTHQNADVEDVSETRNFPSATHEVEARQSTCGDENWDPAFGDHQATYDGSEELYCADGDVDITEELTFETAEGDIEIYVDGDFSISESLEITGGGNVSFFANGSIEPGNDELNTDGEARQLRFYVHSEVDEIDENNNNFGMHGIIYAPGSTVSFDGSIDFSGAIIADEFSANSAGVSVEYDSSLEELDDLGIEPGADEIKYLHITENIIELVLN